MKRTSERSAGPELRIQCEVVRQIRQHARDSMKAEVCGVLIGSEQEAVTVVEACIPGVKAVQGGAQRGRDPVVVLHEQDVHPRPSVRILLPERNPMGSSRGWT